MPHWNQVVRKNFGNQAKARDYISFSDLGKPFIDRFYKMKGAEPTNPFDERTLRIFDAGHVMEFIVLRALTMAGLLHQKQKFVDIPATEKSLKLLGYLDSTIGGFVDFDYQEKIIRDHLTEYKLNLDDQLLEQKAIQIIRGFKESHPKGLVEEMLVEVKSINSMAFWAHKKRNANGDFSGYEHNKLQTYGYMKATGLSHGTLLYISKDDFVLEEVPVVLGDKQLEVAFNEDIRKMTEYIKNDIVPDKEPEIIFNQEKEVFEINWKVKRSSYLTKIYGYRDQDQLEEKHHGLVLDINRALRHLRDSKVVDADKELIKAYKLEDLKRR